MLIKSKLFFTCNGFVSFTRDFFRYKRERVDRLYVREMVRDDLTQVQLIYLRSRSLAFKWIDSDVLELSDFNKDTVDEEVLVAVDSNHIIGFISIFHPDNFIHLLFVDPTQISRGTGSLLLNAALACMGRPARLKCVSANRTALTFYQHNGWHIIDEIAARPPYYNLVYFGE